jgi:hypothetical protein
VTVIFLVVKQDYHPLPDIEPHSWHFYVAVLVGFGICFLYDVDAIMKVCPSHDVLPPHIMV